MKYQKVINSPCQHCGAYDFHDPRCSSFDREVEPTGREIEETLMKENYKEGDPTWEFCKMLNVLPMMVYCSKTVSGLMYSCPKLPKFVWVWIGAEKRFLRMNYEGGLQ